MKTRILMVCLGNICRSPLAEGILRSKLPKKLFEVDSAGTAHYHIGDPPDIRSIKVASQQGIDISNLRGRQFKPVDFQKFDYIFAMDMANRADMLRLADKKEHASKVSLLLEALFPDENMEVPDPYYGTERDFEQVFELLDKATDALVLKLTNHINHGK
ncbi:MAG: low molecular weight protein-tyrosine-phosphatase [Flavobacteriaceae bacterium]|nr:low molecular weight protein-tyrosine-phosphatase [Flavobacteriaceae bacterium]